ncbi:unnamed protein product [Microthlaspi erraticum]|uniref:Uncharacterized protein n=1 Tax=Microthlaspi erraticum TaxID=1685480 RepID=A0A6D2I3L4_9BRAS|nr:unnamed protein product [Microthlaspi erraticum]
MSTLDGVVVEQVTPAAAENVEMPPPKTVEPKETAAVESDAPAPVEVTCVNVDIVETEKPTAFTEEM